MIDVQYFGKNVIEVENPRDLSFFLIDIQCNRNSRTRLENLD